MRQSPLLKRPASRPTPMAGTSPGRNAVRALNGAVRALEQAAGEFHAVPGNPHSRDALTAIKTAQRELDTAMACADAMARGVK